MPSQKGRDLLLKIGNGATPEIFTTIAAARTVDVRLNNQVIDITALNSNGAQQGSTDAGIQSLTIQLDGLFKDAAAEELLRLAAFNRSENNYLMIYPNGDQMTFKGLVLNYQRGGSYDGLESFSVTLQRSGAGTYTP
jgi:TP901-1 family phage major tail protein